MNSNLNNINVANINTLNATDCLVYGDFSAIIPFANYFDFASGSITNITDTNFKLLNCITTNGFTNYPPLVVENNKITNTGKKRIFFLQGIASISSVNNNEIHFAFFKNGALWPCSEQETITSAGGKSTACPFSCLIELDTNDFIQVYVKNSTAANNITLDNINVICRAFT